MLLALVTWTVACDMDSRPEAERDEAKVEKKLEEAGDDAAAAVDRVAADNPPFQQAENKTDIDITAEIRRQVLDHDALGVNADNAKITTVGGVVTLRGRVDSDAEKSAIEQIARGVSGVTRVQNELEVGGTE
jgi:osmotically-inducible protein OsmY